MNRLAVLLLLFFLAEATSEPLKIGRLKYGGGGDWYVSESTVPNWLRHLQNELGIQVHPSEIIIDLARDSLFSVHILYATGHGNIAFSQSEAQLLRKWLLAGGFWFVNDSYGMDPYFRRSIRQVFPDRNLEPLAFDHPVYRSVNNLPGLPKIHEHDGLPAQGYAIFEGGRMLVFYAFSSDIGDGLEDESVHKDPPGLREQAFQFIENLTFYALHPPSLLP